MNNLGVIQYRRILPVLLKNDVVPFVWGPQGVGKTQVTKQIAASLGDEYKFISLHMATQEPGDLLGLLNRNPDGTVSHLRPRWMPKEGKGVLFLDELNRAHPDTIQAIFSLITEKRIHEHHLPSGWKIVAAGNFNNENFTVTDTSDAAWMSRFCHLVFQPSAQEFISYADSQDMGSVADFIREHETLLETAGKAPEMSITPDRRSWVDMVGRLEREEMLDEDRYTVYAGIVGDIAATTFMTFKNTEMKRVKLSQVVSNYKKVKKQIQEMSQAKDNRFDVLGSIMEELKAELSNNPNYFTDKKLANFKEFMLDIPLELATQNLKAFTDLTFERKNDIVNDPMFLNKLFKTN